MDINVTKVSDEKTKSTIYTLTKKDDNKKSALIRVIDYGNNGLDNTDGIIAKGETSVFTNEEIKSKIFDKYQNTNAKSNLPEADYSETNGKLNINTDKEYSLGSVAKLLGVNPAAPATSSTPSSVTAQTFPNIASLSTGMPMIDTSLFDGYGMGQTGASMPNFDMKKYQDAMKSYTGIGTLAGVLSSIGGDCDFFSSTLIPMLAASMLPKVGNFFTSAPTAPVAPAVTNTNAAATTSTSAPAPTSNTTAQTSTSTTPSSTTEKTTTTAPVLTTSTSSVAEADKAYKELTKAKSEKSKVTTVYYHDGTIAEKFTDEKTGDRIVDHRSGKGGKTLSRVRYFKGTHDSRAEFFDGDKNGLIIKTYTDKETGKRVAEQWKRVSAKTIKPVKKTYFTGKTADEAKTETAKTRNTEIDAKVKDLKVQQEAARKNVLNATSAFGIKRATEEHLDINAKISEYNKVKNSAELRKLDEELASAIKELNRAKVDYDKAPDNDKLNKSNQLATANAKVETIKNKQEQIKSSMIYEIEKVKLPKDLYSNPVSCSY